MTSQITRLVMIFYRLSIVTCHGTRCLATIQYVTGSRETDDRWTQPCSIRASVSTVI